MSQIQEVPEGVFLTLDNAEYWSPASIPNIRIPIEVLSVPSEGNLIPVGILTLTNDKLSVDEIADRMQNADLASKFATNIVICDPHGSYDPEFRSDLTARLKDQGAQVVGELDIENSRQLLDKATDISRVFSTLRASVAMPSDCDADTLALQTLYELIRDTHHHFEEGRVECASESSGKANANFQAFNLVKDDGHRRIPVSAVRYLENRSFSDLSHIRGVQMTIKPTYALEGTQLTAGNIAFGALYGIQTQTSPCLNGLVELGLKICATSKMSSHASHFDGPDQHGVFADGIVPKNPRSHLLQSSGSSGGAAMSTAAYAQVDGAFGGDTMGSLRNPAACGGVYCLKNSPQQVDMTGIHPFFPHSDSSGFCVRDPRLFTLLGRAMSRSSTDEDQAARARSIRVVYDRDALFFSNSSACQILTDFIEKLGSMPETRVEPIDTAEFVEDEDFRDDLAGTIDITQQMMSLHSYKLFGERFIADAAAAGVDPQINPTLLQCWPQDEEMKAQWREGEKYLQGHMERIKDTGEWFTEVMLDCDNTTETTIFLHEHYAGEQSLESIPSDPARKAFQQKTGASLTALSSIGQAIEATWPIGEYVDERIGKIPLCVGAIVAPQRGEDLFRFMDMLTESDVLKAVKTGSSMF